jgi:SAM-dependent methyltransferase
LAQAGYYVVGIDASPAMLERAARRFQACGIPAAQYQLLCQPMEAVNLPLQAGLVFSALNSFAHLTTPEQQVSALRAARALLVPRGRLILDLFNPLTQGIPERDGLLTLRNVFQDGETGSTIYQIETWQIEPEHQLLHVTYFYDYVQENGQMRRLVRSFPLRYSYRYEIEGRLEQAGFRVEDIFGSYELDPFTSSAEKMIFVARPGNT